MKVLQLLVIATTAAHIALGHIDLSSSTTATSTSTPPPEMSQPSCNMCNSTEDSEMHTMLRRNTERIEMLEKLAQLNPSGMQQEKVEEIIAMAQEGTEVMNGSMETETPKCLAKVPLFGPEIDHYNEKAMSLVPIFMVALLMMNGFQLAITIAKLLKKRPECQVCKERMSAED